MSGCYNSSLKSVNPNLFCAYLSFYVLKCTKTLNFTVLQTGNRIPFCNFVLSNLKTNYSIMITRQQPAFWLEVRKEYIVDNYDTLLPYLRGYHYEGKYEDPNSDFNKTYNCLRGVVDDIRHSMDEDNVYSHVAQQWEEAKLKKNVGLIAAYLLASQKKGVSDDDTLTALCSILLDVEKNPDTELLADMQRLAASCAANMDVVVYGFNWEDILKIPQYSLSLFCQKTGKTIFRLPSADGYQFLEGKGLLTIDNGQVTLAPMNKADYEKSDLQKQIELPTGISIKVRRLEKTNKTEFPELIDTCNDMIRGLANVTPSTKKELKTYEIDDVLTVRVLSNKYGFVECESIDPNYNKVRGGVFIPFKIFNYFKDLFTVTKDSLTSALRIDDTLRVRRQENDHYPFIIDSQIFKDFNNAYIEDMQPHSCDAVHMMGYAGGNGNRWLTDTGIQVNVLGKLNDEMRQAVDNGQPVRIRIIESKKDKSGNWVVNGKYIFDEPPAFTGSYEDFIRQARDSFQEAFLNYYYVAPEETLTIRNSFEASPIAVPLLISILYRYSKTTSDTTLRYQYLFVARFLAAIISDNQSEGYLHQQMRYQECLVHFALGDQTASTLSVRDNDDLPNLPVLRNEKSIVEQLSKYQDMSVERLQLQPGHDVNIDYLSEMVTASNVLRGKLEPSEMNRIKKSIADYLGVADIYQNITRDYTDYGEESDTLEFKTSVVFPPNNNMHADLAAQKWAILKAVCGFLNTVSGGEVLLGVTDNGTACGLKNDLEYLYTHKFIGSQTMDSYRRYVKTFIDNAFIDNHKVEGLDVTSTVISYVIEHNNEGDDLLRIQVHPYESGIVSFRDEYLPEGIARSYYRTSGASVKMDEKLMKQVKERKGLKK